MTTIWIVTTFAVVFIALAYWSGLVHGRKSKKLREAKPPKLRQGKVKQDGESFTIEFDGDFDARPPKISTVITNAGEFEVGGIAITSEQLTLTLPPMFFGVPVEGPNEALEWETIAENPLQFHAAESSGRVGEHAIGWFIEWEVTLSGIGMLTGRAEDVAQAIDDAERMTREVLKSEDLDGLGLK